MDISLPHSQERVLERSTPPKRALATIIAGLVLFATLLFLAVNLNTVSITDTEGMERTFFTLSSKEDAIVRLSSVPVGEYDTVAYTQEKDGTSALHIFRAFPVEITSDGTSQTAQISVGNTADALSQLGITLEGDDYTSIPLDEPLEKGAAFAVHRVEYVDTISEVEVPSPIVYEYSSLVRGGRSYTLQQGTAGVSQLTERERWVDGELESTTTLEEQVLLAPTETIVLAYGNQPVSDLEGPAVVAGVPTSYSSVIPNAVCTAYASNGRGASGRGLGAGTVAVDPNVIPYGTKLYITSADGSFVYGYAIASDTGTALMEGIIDVDVCYDTYLESTLHGKRLLNVYII